MPQLRKPTQKVIHLFLPSTDTEPEENRAWVELDVGSLTTGDILSLQNMDGSHVLQTQGEILAHRIKDWNFTDESGVKSPIDYESVARLELDDFQFLVTEMNKPEVQNDDQKKSLIGS